MNSPVSTDKPPIPINRRRPLAVLLLDISGSMGIDEPRRIDVLWEAVKTLSKATQGWKMATFSDQCRWQVLEEKPEPTGGTDLTKAFQHVGQVPLTRLTLVTDGEPWDMDEAHRAGLALGVPISILFVGDDTDVQAVAFCQRLCLQTQGTFAKEPLTLASRPRISQTIQRMLGTGTSPKPSIAMGG